MSLVDVHRALSLFEPVWDVLLPRERARILGLLLEVVEYDGTQGALAPTFYPLGIGRLANESGSRGAGRGCGSMRDGPTTVRFSVHLARPSHKLVLRDDPRPAPVQGTVPRVARLLALAYHFERLLAEGIVRTQGELAALAGVTRPRVMQILNLLLLAPGIQEKILFLPPAEHGPEPITERTLRYVLRTPLWREQRARWAEIRDA